MKISTSARSPLSPTLWPANAFIWWRSALFAIGVVIVAILATVVAAVAYGVAFGTKEMHPPSLTFALTLQFVLYASLFAGMIVVLPLLARRSLRDLGFRVPSLSEAGVGLAGAFGMFVVSTAIGAFEQQILHLKVQEAAVDLLKSVHGPTAIAFGVLACVVAPLVEEFAFRAFLFNALFRYLPAAAAMILSALLFGLAHGSLTALAPLAGAGLILALVYYRTGALSASMISHAGFNLIGVVGFLVFKVA